MTFEITAREVERLNESQFADLMDHLLLVEGGKLKIPPTNVITSTKITSADDGIDSFIADSKLSDGRWLPQGDSAWQYKTGDSASRPRRLAKEALKRGVARTLRSGGWYRLAISRICTKVMRRAREDRIKRALQTRRLPTSRFKLLTADDIAHWASEHPSMTLLTYFQRPIGGCMSLEHWRKDPKHHGAFVRDDARNNIIARLQSFTALAQAGQVHFRLLGRRGVGKTRLVMESLNMKGMGERVLYAQDPEGLPPELWAWFRGAPLTSAVIVIDECEEKEAEMLRAQASACDGRVRLITIGVGEPFLRETSAQSHHFLDKLDPRSMRELLHSRSARLSHEQVDWVVRNTGGYVKLAVACADVLSMKPDADGAQLVSSVEVRSILEALLPEPMHRKVMQALSLLTKVGCEGELISEGQALAKFVNVSWSEFVGTVSEMSRRGIVGKGGRYRFVTPDLLAQWLATDVWRTRFDDLTSLLNTLTTRGSKESLFERMKDLETDEKTGRILETLVSEASIPNITAVDNEAVSRFVHEITIAQPQLGLRALHRLIRNATPDELRKFSIGRTHVIWALEYLKWFKEWFQESSTLLLALAQEENSTYGNNATGTWTGIFRLRLGGTEVSMFERLEILKEILSRNSSASKKLALKALEVMFSHHEVRFSASEASAPKPVPKEWHPKTMKEVWEIYRVGLRLVDQAMGEGDVNISSDARNVLLSSARTLVISGLTDDIITRLERYVPQSEPERRKAREEVRSILEYESDKLSINQREQLAAIEETLTGKDFSSRLRRWVGQWSFGDWNIHERDGGPPPQVRASLLAKEALERPSDFRVNLPWLLSGEAHHIAYFGKGLGEIDSSRLWLAELIVATKKEGSPLLLASYLWGRSNAGEHLFVESLLEEWALNDRELARTVLATSRNLEPSNTSLLRVLKLVEIGWLERRELAQLVWGWSEKIPLEGFQKLLENLLPEDSNLTIEASLYALTRRLELYPNEKSALSFLVWKVLDKPSSVKGPMPNHYWGQIGKKYAETDSLKIAEAIVNIHEDDHVYLDEDDPPMQVLATATRSNEGEVWKIIGNAILRKDAVAMRLQMALRGWYVNNVSVKILLEWANSNSARARILAGLTTPTGLSLADLPRGLLEKYGNDERVSSALSASFRSGSFQGSIANWLTSKLKLAEKWTEDPSPQVRSWARKLVQSFQEEIRLWKTREEEEQLA